MMHQVSKVVKNRLGELAQHLDSSVITKSNMAQTLVDTQRLFLSAPKYAVVGASKDRQKFGNKVSLHGSRFVVCENC